jgi:hypothetical protein
MLMQNKPLILIAGLVVIVGGYLAFNYSPLEKNIKEEEKVDELPLLVEEIEASEASPVFSWSFAEAKTNNPDGNPQTEVYLTASYSDGSRVEKLVDTVDGSCSELEGEKYEGDISNTGKVQCYYAGLGQQYRIIESENSHRVERKFFEESLPDYVPPESPWEVVADFIMKSQ